MVSGTLTLYASQLRNSKVHLAEIKLHQELRLSADLIARQLRNSGYWSGALNGTLSDADGSNPPQNAYANVNLLMDGSGIIFNQNYDTDNVLNSSEMLGFRLNKGIIQSQLGENNWQDITDPKSIQITHFFITHYETRQISSTASNTSFSPCSKACTDINTCPSIWLRSYKIVIGARAPLDANIQRGIEQIVRVRNDQITGTCPA